MAEDQKDAPLIIKYRPRDFDEVVGHDDAMGALKRMLSESTHSHGYLLTGFSGVGKTTIARIIAKHLKSEVIEIDAASFSGVDAMRELVENGMHRAISGAGSKMFIIDECHTLSKSAWQALLKLLEEPPTHLYIALCTTELIKVPDTIRTRCYHVVLKPVKTTDIEDLLLAIIGLEKWNVNDDVLRAVVQASLGSPRKAISILQVVHDAPSREEARRIISLQDASDPLLELIQFILSGKRSWTTVRTLLSKIEDEAFEDTMIATGRYVAAAMLHAENEKTAARAWTLLEALVYPAATFDKKAAFYAAIGRTLWSGGDNG